LLNLTVLECGPTETKYKGGPTETKYKGGPPYNLPFYYMMT